MIEINFTVLQFHDAPLTPNKNISAYFYYIYAGFCGGFKDNFKIMIKDQIILKQAVR